MMEPTQEQTKELWEWCGYEGKLDYIEDVGEVEGKLVYIYPPIDLNNLFKYAVPKLFEELSKKGESYKFDRIWKAVVRALLDKDDIGLSVFWTIWELVK